MARNRKRSKGTKKKAAQAKRTQKKPVQAKRTKKKGAQTKRIQKKAAQVKRPQKKVAQPKRAQKKAARPTGAKKKVARPAARKKPELAAAETGSASTDQPQFVETTEAELLPSPPEPTPEQVELRESCIDRTHKEAGPKLKEPRGKRGSAPEASASDVPESTPRPPD